MRVYVKLPDREPFECNVTDVADIARPPTIGVSNVVKYDVTVELPKKERIETRHDRGSGNRHVRV